MPEPLDPEMFHILLDSLPTAVYVVDRNGKILFWNQGAERITGHLRHEVLGHSRSNSILTQCNEVSCPACGEECPFSNARKEGKPRELRLALHHKLGHSLPVVFRITPLRDPQGSIIYVAGSFEEQRRREGDRNQRTTIPQACLDESGVANRELIQFHLRKNLAGFAEHQLPFSVLCIELDQFDHLRTTYGREASDAMARAVAETLRDSLRPSDFVGRWAEDQFLVILSNCGSLGVQKAGERIHRMVTNAGIHWWGDWLRAITFMGHAAAQTGDTVHSLMQRAQPRGRPVTSELAAAGTGAASPETNPSGG